MKFAKCKRGAAKKSLNRCFSMQCKKQKDLQQKLKVFPMCPRQESNLYELMLTTPSKWRVYQFHHLGSFAAAKIQLFYFLFTK